MLTTALAKATCSAAAALTGAVIAQVPVDTEVGEWSKLGVSGACLLIAFWLLAKTIPSILQQHQEANEAMRKTMAEGLAKVEASNDKATAAINAGNDKVSTLLQSTLVQLFKDKHES